MKTISIILRLLVSIILLQSLYFKFSGHAEAVHIFSTLGVEPWGRLGLATVELLVGVGLLFNKTYIRAAFLATGLMVGAIGVHLLTPVGIAVQWDGMSDNGQLFAMAVTAFIASILIQYFRIKKNKYSLVEYLKKEILTL